MNKLSIVIPCYNEEKNINPLFEKIEELLDIDRNLEIIIVNNGSTDNTKKNIINSNLAREGKIIIHEIKENIGYGYGIMSGVKISTGQFIGWCHADLQSEPKDFKTGSLSSRSSLNSNENVALAFGTRILEPQKSEATLPSRPYYNEETAT